MFYPKFIQPTNNVVLLCLLVILDFTPSHAQTNTVGLINSSEDVYEGYTLLAPNNYDTYLIDNCGLIVNQWTSEYKTSFSASYLMDNGDLLHSCKSDFLPFNAGGSAGRLEIYGWDGVLKWATNYTSESALTHHDMAILPNGNILLLVLEKIEHSEVLAKGMMKSDTEDLWSEKVVEISPNYGSTNFTLVWEWRAWDHIIQDKDPLLSTYGDVSSETGKLDLNYIADDNDWLHINSIDYSVTKDQILLSSRSWQEIYIIDHSTTISEAKSSSGGQAGKGGDFLYRWGNPATYRRGEETDKQLFAQHSARWTNADDIIIFNNGPFRPEGLFSDIIELKTPANGFGYTLNNGSAYGPDAPYWTYQADPPESFYASRISSVQRLDDERVLINEGTAGRLFEVNRAGNMLWEYINPVTSQFIHAQGETPSRNEVFRADKYAYDHPAFKDKILTPGLPIELNPLPNDCIPSAISETHKSNVDFHIYDGIIYFKAPLKEKTNLEVYNLTGQLILSENILQGSATYKLSGLSSQIYLIKLQNKKGSYTKLEFY